MISFQDPRQSKMEMSTQSQQKIIKIHHWHKT